MAREKHCKAPERKLHTWMTGRSAGALFFQTQEARKDPRAVTSNEEEGLQDSGEPKYAG